MLLLLLLLLWSQNEIECSGEGGIMMDDGGSFDAMYDDERMMMRAGPGGAPHAGGPPGMGRIKR
jgi:hypothetical protein